MSDRVKALFAQALIWASRPTVNCWQSIIVEILRAKLTLNLATTINRNKRERMKIQLKCSRKFYFSYIHAVPVAFVWSVKSFNLIVEMKCEWLKRNQWVCERIRWELLLMILIGWESIVVWIWIMTLAIKLIRIQCYITLINVQLRHIDVDAQESTQSVSKKDGKSVLLHIICKSEA